MKTIACATLLLGLAEALPATAAELATTYAVKGTNPDGSTYGGTASIAMTGPQSCTFTWSIGGALTAGICARKDGALAVSYQYNGKMGVAVYTLRPDATIDGIWSLAGAPGSGREVLTRQ